MQSMLSPEVMQVLQQIREQRPDQSQGGMRQAGQRQFSPELLQQMQGMRQSMVPPTEDQGGLPSKFQSMITPELLQRIQEEQNQQAQVQQGGLGSIMQNPRMLESMQAAMAQQGGAQASPQGGGLGRMAGIARQLPSERPQGMRQNTMVPTPQMTAPQRQINPEMMQFLQSRMRNV